jgi:hypothetical protein
MRGCVQGSSQAVRAGGAAKFVALHGLGPAAKLKVSSDWGPSPFQSFGTTVAVAAKANKAKTAGVALVGVPLSGVGATIGSVSGGNGCNQRLSPDTDSQQHGS